MLLLTTIQLTLTTLCLATGELIGGSQHKDLKDDKTYLEAMGEAIDANKYYLDQNPAFCKYRIDTVTSYSTKLVAGEQINLGYILTIDGYEKDCHIKCEGCQNKIGCTAEVWRKVWIEDNPNTYTVKCEDLDKLDKDGKDASRTGDDDSGDDDDANGDGADKEGSSFAKWFMALVMLGLSGYIGLTLFRKWKGSQSPSTYATMQ